MKRVFLLVFLFATLGSGFQQLLADETVTVTATTSDISENLDLKTVATLFGQAKDLEQFEQLLNNPDSAFSNLDLNGDGEVDYLRVVETADGNRHLVVIQAVLAKDIYQDVASIFLEKDEKDQITVQVVGDEYIYGANYIIEPVYIYRPYIYDWFWGASWVAWHSPYYWGYWPSWWHPFHCIDPFLYWDHCYWHHYHYPCSFRTAHHHHPHYRGMHDRVRRNDYAHRHPERSFATRNASRNVSNARAFEQSRRTAVREANATRGTAPSSRISGTSRTSSTRVATYGSTNVRGTSRTGSTSQRVATPSRTSTSQRVATPSRTSSTSQRVATPSRTSSTSQRVATPSRTGSTSQRVATPSRTSSTSQRVATPSRSSSSSSTMRSSSSSSTIRSSAPSMPRSSGSMSTSRSSGSMSSGSRSGGSSRR